MRISFLPRSTLRAQSTRRFLDDETRYASIDLDEVVQPQISYYFIIRSVILELCGYPSREKPAKSQLFSGYTNAKYRSESSANYKKPNSIYRFGGFICTRVLILCIQHLVCQI